MRTIIPPSFGAKFSLLQESNIKFTNATTLGPHGWSLGFPLGPKALVGKKKKKGKGKPLVSNGSSKGKSSLMSQVHVQLYGAHLTQPFISVDPFAFLSSHNLAWSTPMYSIYFTLLVGEYLSIWKWKRLKLEKHRSNNPPLNGKRIKKGGNDYPTITLVIQIPG